MNRTPVLSRQLLLAATSFIPVFFSLALPVPAFARAQALPEVYATAVKEQVRIKELTRIEGVRDYALVGYGLVVGLSGSGDSAKNQATRQSLVNTLKHFNVNVAPSDLSSVNAAVVMVTASIGAFNEPGDRLDVEVSSLGDARSLVGGMLLLAPLNGPDEQLYALAQGPVSVGGYAFQVNANSQQKNHPTVGRVPHGASVERALAQTSVSPALVLLLNDPDYTTAERIALTISHQLGLPGVCVIHAGKVSVPMPAGLSKPALIAEVERLSVTPDYAARVVINERTGTVVAGANVRIGEVNIAQGDLSVSVSTRFLVSQPSLLIHPNAQISTTVVPDTHLNVTETRHQPLQLSAGTRVADLVQALFRIKLSTREIITVLQAIKQAGALHADLIIQ